MSTPPPIVVACSCGVAMLRGKDCTATARSPGFDHQPAKRSTLAPATEGHCDFCLAYGPAWQMPVAEFASTTRRDSDGRDFGTLTSEGAWLACDECAGDILRRRWSRLVSRARDNNRKATGIRVPRSYYVTLFDRVQSNATGPLRTRTSL